MKLIQLLKEIKIINPNYNFNIIGLPGVSREQFLKEAAEENVWEDLEIKSYGDSTTNPGVFKGWTFENEFLSNENFLISKVFDIEVNPASKEIFEETQLLLDNNKIKYEIDRHGFMGDNDSYFYLKIKTKDNPNRILYNDEILVQ